MAHFTPRLITTRGQEYILVATHDVEQWSYTTARETLLAVLRDGLGGDDVRRLAEEHGYLGEASDVESIASCLAVEIASGRLVPVSMPNPYHGMRPVMGAEDPNDVWANAVPLSSLSDGSHDEAAWTWLDVQFVDPWWRPFAGMTVELELPSGEVVQRGLDGDARVRLDGLRGPRRACRAWLPTSSPLPCGRVSVARPRSGETGHARRGGPPVQLELETQNVIIVEVPHVPSW